MRYPVGKRAKRVVANDQIGIVFDRYIDACGSPDTAVTLRDGESRAAGWWLLVVFVSSPGSIVRG